MGQQTDQHLAASVITADGRTLHLKVYQAREETTNSVLIGSYDEGKEQLEKVLAKLIRDMADDDQLVQALFAANKN